MISFFKDSICIQCKSKDLLIRRQNHMGTMIIPCLTCGAIEWQNVVTCQVTKQLVTRPRYKNRNHFKTYRYQRIIE